MIRMIMDEKDDDDDEELEISWRHFRLLPSWESHHQQSWPQLYPYIYAQHHHDDGDHDDGDDDNDHDDTFTHALTLSPG